MQFDLTEYITPKQIEETLVDSIQFGILSRKFNQQLLHLLPSIG